MAATPRSRSAQTPRPRGRTTVLATLTDRQRQVVELIAAGCSNVEVAERLGITTRTAKAHSDALRQKLGVTRRRQIPVAYRLVTGDDHVACMTRCQESA